MLDSGNLLYGPGMAGGKQRSATHEVTDVDVAWVIGEGDDLRLRI